MAYLMDEEEQQAGQEGSAPGATPATAAPSSSLGSAGGAPGSGFQNLSAYFGANQDAAKGQADSLVGKLDAAADDAYQTNDIDKAEAARQDIDAAQTQPGLASLYREGAPPTYTSGQAGLDAYLAGRAGGDRFSGLTKHFGILDNVGQSRDIPLSTPKTPEYAPPSPSEYRGPQPGDTRTHEDSPTPETYGENGWEPSEPAFQPTGGLPTPGAKRTNPETGEAETFTADGGWTPDEPRASGYDFSAGGA